MLFNQIISTINEELSMKLFKILSIALILWGLVFVGAGQAATFYVRPAGGSYGSEDGSSYANAFDGFADINWAALAGNNTLFVAGTHFQQLSVGASGTDTNNRLYIKSCTIANGASTDNPGIINGVSAGTTGAVDMHGRNYVTIDGLTITNTTGTEGHGILITAGTGTALGVTIRNCNINGNSGDGIYVDGAASPRDVDNLIIEFNDIKNNDMCGYFGERIKTSCIIRYNYFYANGQSTDPLRCAPGDTGGSFYHNIYVGANQNGGTHYVYGNRLENDACGQGIKIKNNADVYWNYIKDNKDFQIMHIEYSGITCTQRAWANVIIQTNNAITAIQNYQEGNGNIRIYDYNNSIYMSNYRQSWNAGIGTGLGDTLVAKNNAIYVPSGAYCYHSGNGVPGSTTIENNLCYGPSSNVAYWVGGSRSWTYWTTTLGFDYPNGRHEDPKYTAPGSNDLTLQASSPCIDYGENLGSTFQMALDPSTTWTLKNPGIVESSVVTINQNSYGTGWEIGAYVYGYDPSPTPPQNVRLIP